MHSRHTKIRFIMAALAAVAVSACAVFTSDYCTPATCQPVRSQPEPYGFVSACDPCSAVSGAAVSASAPAGGAMISGYSVYPTSYSSTWSNTGITYLIPTMNGFVETHEIPITNEVDRYYATHQIINGQIVTVPYPSTRF